MCHGGWALALAVATLGCAPRSGWTRLDRVCQSDDPPRVCFEADPDAPLTLEVGGAVLVPGECAQAPEAKRASLKAVVVDGRDGQRYEQRVGAGRGRVATVTAVAAEDGLELDADRDGCGN